MSNLPAATAIHISNEGRPASGSGSTGDPYGSTFESTHTTANHRAARLIAESEAYRAQLVRFGVIVEKVLSRLSMRTPHAMGVYELGDEDRAELAAAFAQIILVNHEPVRTEAEGLWSSLHTCLVSASNHSGPLDAGAEAALRSRLALFWDAARVSAVSTPPA